MKDKDAEIRRLQAEVERLQAELKKATNTIHRAKDPNPVQRCSLKRVFALVKNACMTLVRDSGGWVLKFGNLRRRFRYLRQIWEILITDDWVLSSVFSPPPDPPKRERVMPRLPYRSPAIAPALQIPF